MVSEEEKVTHCFSKEGSLTFLAVTRARIVQFLLFLAKTLTGHYAIKK